MVRLQDDSLLTALLRQLQDHAPPPDPQLLRTAYPDQWRQLAELVSRAADTGDSNSALIIGPRGVGKTALLNEVLRETGVGRDDASVLVHLHGLMQTDDRIAIREITKQLRLEAEVVDKSFSSFADNLAFLLESLRGGRREELKTVIFIMEEFDLFCQHKNQTLLYNLFDVAQSAQAPVCVLGVTARLDVLELMEKRVKSRFSHRQLHLFGLQTVQQYLEVARCYLTAPDQRRTGRQWRDSVQHVLNHVKVQECLERLYDSSRNIRVLKNYLRLVLSRLGPDSASLQVPDFTQVMTTLSVDSRASTLLGLSVLELCLVIAMQHLTRIYDEPFNFEMVFREYNKFASRRSTFQSFSRPVVMKAYENLQWLELVRPVEQGAGGAARGQKQYQLFTLTVTAQQVSDTVLRSSILPTEKVASLHRLHCSAGITML